MSTFWPVNSQLGKFEVERSYLFYQLRSTQDALKINRPSRDHHEICNSITVKCTIESLCANGNTPERSLLCVKDDFWYLTVLHRRAVIIACGVAEREAGFGSRTGQLVRDLTHPFSAVM